MFNVISFIRDSIKDSRALRSLFTDRTLSCTVTKGTNWSTVEVGAVLVGNCLRLNLDATRKSASGAGNIVNEQVCTAKIDTQGLIKAVYNISFCSGATGPVTTFATTGLEMSGNILSVDIYMVATERAVTDTTAYFIMSVVPDIEAHRSGGGYSVIRNLISKRRWAYA